MAENPENTQKPKTETTKIEGISAQINLSPGSDTHRRFAQHMKDSGATTARAFIELLLDLYEHPHVETDNSEVIADLEHQLDEARGEIAAYEATQQNDEAEIEDLKMQLAEARNEANENATKALQIQTETDGAIILHPNPVSAFFLKEMSEKTGRTPGKILEKLFVDDLQNPRSNNLPYDVSGSRVREVMNQLKKEAANE